MTLEESKLHKLGILDADFNLDILEGTVINVPTKGDMYMRGESSVSRLNVASTLIGAGVVSDPTVVYDSESNEFSLTKVEIDSVIIQAMEWGYQRMIYKENLRKQVNYATTVAEINSINYLR